MKIIAITQARTGSTRFPNKIMNRIEGKTLLSIHIDRIKNSKKTNTLIIATTNKKMTTSLSSKLITWGFIVIVGMKMMF